MKKDCTFDITIYLCFFVLFLLLLLFFLFGCYYFFIFENLHVSSRLSYSQAYSPSKSSETVVCVPRGIVILDTGHHLTTHPTDIILESVTLVLIFVYAIHVRIAITQTYLYVWSPSPRMLCAKFDSNWPSGSVEEEFFFFYI